MKRYGYIRVSTVDQNEARQRESMRAAHVDAKCVFVDRQSGKDFERTNYKRLVARLKAGDILVVHSIDRLGRNYREIQEQWRLLTKEKGVDIVVLDMPLLDTRCAKDLMGAFIADLVLQILSFVAENERLAIRARQAEGIAAAKARGKHLGRPKPKLSKVFLNNLDYWQRGEITASVAAQRCEMTVTTFLYRARKYAPNKK